MAQPPGCELATASTFLLVVRIFVSIPGRCQFPWLGGYHSAYHVTPPELWSECEGPRERALMLTEPQSESAVSYRVSSWRVHSTAHGLSLRALNPSPLCYSLEGSKCLLLCEGTKRQDLKKLPSGLEAPAWLIMWTL